MRQKKNGREERSEKESEREREGQRNSFFFSGRDRKKKGTVITKVVCGQMFGKGKNAKTVHTSIRREMNGTKVYQKLCVMSPD